MHSDKSCLQIFKALSSPCFLLVDHERDRRALYREFEFVPLAVLEQSFAGRSFDAANIALFAFQEIRLIAFRPGAAFWDFVVAKVNAAVPLVFAKSFPFVFEHEVLVFLFGLH